MIIRNMFLQIMLICASPSFCEIPLAEAFKRVGYVEIYDTNHGAEAYDALYAQFDALIAFLQANPNRAQKLYCAKERFIRSKDRDYYATDFFGFYDESQREGRRQISFYYSIHFHEFLCAQYPEFKNIPEVMNFLESCREIQAVYGSTFNEASAELGLDIFAASSHHPPILFKVVKYLPSYIAERPHYDGSAFSLFLDSTDNQSLLVSAYKPVFAVADFSSPVRQFNRCERHNSILLIPGALLAEFSIDPTPHIVAQSNTVRYATIAFAMRPKAIVQKNEFSALPNFKH